MAWPNTLFILMPFNDKAWVILRTTADERLALRFSGDQIASMKETTTGLNSEALAQLKIPKFCFRNPLLNYYQTHRHENRSVDPQSLTFSLWASEILSNLPEDTECTDYLRCCSYSQLLQYLNSVRPEIRRSPIKIQWKSSIFDKILPNELNWLSCFLTHNQLRNLYFSDTQIDFIKNYNTGTEFRVPLFASKNQVILDNHTTTNPHFQEGRVTYKQWFDMVLSYILTTGTIKRQFLDMVCRKEEDAPDQNPEAPIRFNTGATVSNLGNLTNIQQIITSPQISTDRSRNEPTTVPEMSWRDQLQTPIPPHAPRPPRSSEDDPNGRHNLSVKYEGCIAIHDGRVALVKDFTEDREGEVKIVFSTINPGGSCSNRISRDYTPDFEFVMPKLGFINFKDYVVSVSRYHKRGSPSKYRRGFRLDSVRFDCISAKEFRVISRPIPNFGADYRFINALFLPTMFTYEEALLSVLAGRRLAAAFTSSLAIRIDSQVNKIALQKNEFIIGYLNTRTNTFDLLSNIANPQLKRLGVKYKEAK